MAHPAPVRARRTRGGRRASGAILTELFLVDDVLGHPDILLIAAATLVVGSGRVRIFALLQALRPNPFAAGWQPPGQDREACSTTRTCGASRTRSTPPARDTADGRIAAGRRARRGRAHRRRGGRGPRRRGRPDRQLADLRRGRRAAAGAHLRRAPGRHREGRRRARAWPSCAGPPRSSSASTPGSRSAGSPRSGHPKPVRTLVDTALGQYAGDLGGGRRTAGGLPDHLRRAAAGHRRHRRPRSR